MTEYKKGQRVKVELEGVIVNLNSHFLELRRRPARQLRLQR